MFPPLRHLLAVSLLASPMGLFGHPFPEIPVRASFSAGADCTLEIEVDPRCFDPEPNAASYLMKAQWDLMTDAEKAELIKEAAAYAKAMVQVEAASLPIGTFSSLGSRERLQKTPMTRSSSEACGNPQWHRERPDTESSPPPNAPSP